MFGYPIAVYLTILLPVIFMSNNLSQLQELFKELLALCKGHSRFQAEQLSENDDTFVKRLTELADGDINQEELYQQGQQLIETIIANYPMITPALNRDILWLLGGNCMHFLSDEELQKYQAIDELIYAAESEGKMLSFKEAKAQAFKLH